MTDTEGLEPCCDCEGFFADCDLDSEGRCSECRVELDAALDEHADAIDAQTAVGEKVIEMCDRVAAAHKIVPGAEEHWVVEIDDQRFEVRVTVAKAAGA